MNTNMGINVSVTTLNNVTNTTQKKIETSIKSETKTETNTELPSFITPKALLSNKKDKTISEGNIKEHIEALDVLNDSDGLDKLLKQYVGDVDKCELATSAKDYYRSVQLVEKKWHPLFEKIENLTNSKDEKEAEKANAVFEEKFFPAIIHLQEMFSKMDNTEMVRSCYNL